MADLPYTYTDADGTELEVESGLISVYEQSAPHASRVLAPTGEDAVALARAVLTAAGDTGHRVISEEDLIRYMYAAEEKGARSMRDRAAEWLEEVGSAWEGAHIRAMTLLPDTAPPPAPTSEEQLAARLAQLENDMSQAENRLAALEIAAREHHQSGGAPRAQVAGGSAPGPCHVTGRHPLIPIDMVCAYDAGHVSPHYSPADAGWTWDDNGNNVTELNRA